MHPYTKRASTSRDLSGPRYTRSESIPYLGSNLSHFDGISWNQMPGEGVPPSRALAGGDSAPQPPAHWDSGMWLALQNASCDAFWLARLFSYKWCSSSPPPTRSEERRVGKE